MNPVLEAAAGLKPEVPSGIRRVALQPKSRAIVIPFIESSNPALEQYRHIRAKVTNDPNGPRLIAVTSGGTKDGKTTTSINLSCALALRGDARVLVVEADLRHPMFVKTLGIEASCGLADLMLGERAFDEVIVQVDRVPNLYILPAGKPGCNAAELFESPSWSSVQQALRKHFDFVILDTPPLGIVPETDIIVKSCDGAIVVIRIDCSDRVTVQTVLDTLPKEKQIGVVVNCVDELFSSRNRYYYNSHGQSPVDDLQ
jgi:capsular exopolysaccharide synthesis family protein